MIINEARASARMDLDQRDYLLLAGIIAIVLLGYLAGPPTRNAVTVDGNGTTALDPAVVERLVDDMPRGALSQVERDHLARTRTDEAVAHDVLRRLAAGHGLPLLEDLAGAEATHGSVTAALLEKYGIADPVTAERGRFTDPRAQDRYDTLTAAGNRSPAAALQAAARLEERSLVGLREALRATDNDDATYVYRTLAMASRNHLRALAGAMDRRDIAYTPRHLNASGYRDIVETEIERSS